MNFHSNLKFAQISFPSRVVSFRSISFRMSPGAISPASVSDSGDTKRAGRHMFLHSWRLPDSSRQKENSIRTEVHGADTKDRRISKAPGSSHASFCSPSSFACKRSAHAKCSTAMSTCEKMDMDYDVPGNYRRQP